MAMSRFAVLVIASNHFGE